MFRREEMRRTLLGGRELLVLSSWFLETRRTTKNEELTTKNLPVGTAAIVAAGQGKVGATRAPRAPAHRCTSAPPARSPSIQTTTQGSPSRAASPFAAGA